MTLISDQKNLWIEVSLPVTANNDDAITNFLFELGAEGCQNQQNLLTSYFKFENWDTQKSQKLINYLDQLIQLGFSVQKDQIRVKEVENQDWNAEWKKQYKPFKIGKKIIIKPSWCEYENDPSKIIIEIDPQMAFGTGTHETTQLIIQLLLDYAVAPKTILDIGTGTGILAIVAAKLFNAKILAFDNDPIAASTAKQNFINNNVADRIEIFCGENLNFKNSQFDLILANINRTVIIQLLSYISKALKPNGHVILSGILDEEKDKIIEKLEQHSLKLLTQSKLGEWVGLVVKH